MAEELKQEKSSEEQYPVKKICSWCGKEMGDAGYMSSKKGEISHGMCSECGEKYLTEIEKDKEKPA